MGWAAAGRGGGGGGGGRAARRAGGAQVFPHLPGATLHGQRITECPNVSPPARPPAPPPLCRQQLLPFAMKCWTSDHWTTQCKDLYTQELLAILIWPVCLFLSGQ